MIWHFCFCFLCYGSTIQRHTLLRVVQYRTVLEFLPNRSRFLLGIDCGGHPVSKPINRSSGTLDSHLFLSSPSPPPPFPHAPLPFPLPPSPLLPSIQAPSTNAIQKIPSPAYPRLPFSLPPPTSAALYSTQHLLPLPHISTVPYRIVLITNTNPPQ